MKIRNTALILAVAIALCAPFCLATQTAFWRLGTFKGFLKGQLQAVSVSMDGQLMLAPETHSIFNPDETVALSVVAGRHGSLYIGTGHQGRVFKLDSQLRGKLLFQAPEPEILAIASGPDGDLYVASSPEGKIYRVTPDGKSSVFYDPKVKYIWALAFDSEGQLYAGTGDRGKILKIGRNGKGEVFFASDQTHIMCLTFDKDGNLLAGSEPGGLIYRITPQGKAFVLYQANLPEIHALATDAQGRIYAAALGNVTGPAEPGGFPPGAEAPGVSTPVATVTVTASGSAAAEDPPQTLRRPLHRRSMSTGSSQSAGIGSPFRAMSRGRGELIQILPNYSAQTLWSSNGASIFGLATRGDDVLFSTDANGHIFDLQPAADGPKLTLLTETRESLPTRILTQGPNLFIATSNIAKLIQVGTSFGSQGTYQSPVKDARFISHWGELSWRAEVPGGCDLVFYVRSGNSARPDNTWSAWMGPYRDAQRSPILSTPARYIQWKAVFHGSHGASPVLREVTLSYLNQNLPPQIHSLSIIDGTEKTTFAGTPITTPGSFEMSAPVTTVATPMGASGVYDSSPSGAETYSYGKPPITIAWEASDPNGDQLTYDLYLKSAEEHDWHLVKGKLKGESLDLQPATLANGEYEVRIVASDEPSNPPSQALKTDLVSAPFWVDNTPPEIQAVSKEVHGNNAVIRFQAKSAGSPLRKAEISAGENGWRNILSDDGIIDSQQEIFTVRLRNLSPGEHVISLRAADTAGNVGVGAAVIEVK